MDNSFSVPLCGVKFVLCADKKVQTNPHPCYAVNLQRVDLTALCGRPVVDYMLIVYSHV